MATKKKKTSEGHTVKTKKAIFIGDDEAFKAGQEVETIERLPDIGYKVHHPFDGFSTPFQTFILFDHELVKPKKTV